MKLGNIAVDETWDLLFLEIEDAVREAPFLAVRSMKWPP
jgi:hypothetical protein